MPVSKKPKKPAASARAPARTGPTASDFERVKAQIAELVERHGWVVITVAPEGLHTPGFSYTVGLRDRGLAEIVMIGLPMEVAHAALNQLAGEFVGGTPPLLGAALNHVMTLPVMLRHVPAERAAPYMRVANERAGARLDALQLVWPDEAAIFPWEQGFNPRMKRLQPMLFS
jgi:hypothetical protein